ncbi:hypothetical protein ACL7TT_09720 [Microbulbifer sp. 2304DJ12-6]|uniref:hypothetical protein n=1 Tax=Microbulbifer sp. 2304DJ12-6 TaxID=3233340 RepID=UPI0039AF59AD
MKFIYCFFLLIITFDAHSENILRGKINLFGVVESHKFATVNLKDSGVDFEALGHPCGRGSSMSINLETELGRAMYSFMLAAYMSDKRIRIDYNGDACGLYGHQPLITRVYFGA